LFKKFINLISKKKSKQNIEKDNNIEIKPNIQEEVVVTTEEIIEDTKEEVKETTLEETDLKDKVVEEISLDKEEIVEKQEDLKENNEQLLNEELIKENEKFINDIKLIREKKIRAIDVYTNEVIEFESFKECSKKLKVPVTYIKENLKYNHTDYLGEAINFLKKELGESVKDKNAYLNSDKNPIELFKDLNNKIFNSNLSELKIDEILSNSKIEPIKMHYKFESLDEEYDDYFKKYGSIIKRGGKKKIELVNQKGEVIEVFKSLDKCSEHLNKDKKEISKMLKCGMTKVGRYEIRYSLRNI